MSPLGKWLGYSYRRRLLDRDLMASRSLFRGRVLDVGGMVRARGRFSSLLCPEAGPWTRVNITPEAGPDVLADGEHLPFGDHTADTVVCTEVLEYLSDPAGAFREMARVLKTGGALVLSVPFVHRVDSPADRWRFSERWLAWQCAQTGLETVALKAQGGAMSVVAHVAKNTLVQTQNWFLRSLLGLALFPVLEALCLMDACLPPIGWSTGYLLVARKKAQ